MNRRYSRTSCCEQVSFVWYDYWRATAAPGDVASPPHECHPSDVTPIRCMPQGKRTPTEKVGFKRMLQNVRPLL